MKAKPLPARDRALLMKVAKRLGGWPAVARTIEAQHPRLAYSYNTYRAWALGLFAPVPLVWETLRPILMDLASPAPSKSIPRRRQ